MYSLYGIDYTVAVYEEFELKPLVIIFVAKRTPRNSNKLYIIKL